MSNGHHFKCRFCGNTMPLQGACNCPKSQVAWNARKVDESVDHPAHYGGKENPYEVIKVIEAWGLGFNLGNSVKYIGRAGKKGPRLEDLKKAAWYLATEIEKQERCIYEHVSDPNGDSDSRPLGRME